MSRRQLTSLCKSCQSHLSSSPSSVTILQRQPFSTSRSRPQDYKDSNTTTKLFQDALRSPKTSNIKTSMAPAASSPLQASRARNSMFRSQQIEALAETARTESMTRPESGVSLDEPYHLNIYSHKHNMHITFTEPTRNPILSFSAGNIGLKKAQRGTYDAAYQLTTYTFRKLAEKQWRSGGKNSLSKTMLTLNEADVINRGIEIVLRGYGPGREAFTKALLGTEGRLIKPMVKKVTDSTRLKFGGVRSRATRRLG